MGGLSQSYPTAVVTGASSGLGLAFTRMLLEEGIRVIGLSRQPDVLPDEPSYIPVACDLSKTGSVEATLEQIIEEHSSLRLVINNAGFGILESLSEMDAGDIERQYAVMLEAPTIIASKATGYFKQVGAGCLVNVSSLAVELPLPLMPVYNASKAGLSALSESLILDEVDGRFQVIDFRPGDFNTSFAERMEGELLWNGVNLREVMDRHHAVAPDASLATAALRRALVRNRSGIVRVGDFFQSRIAPWGRLLPRAWLRGIIRGYYKK
ncbi:MAG: SDR family NAD(P)-dependent oxidoreductase [Verrucomicrobiota bacterium]